MALALSEKTLKGYLGAIYNFLRMNIIAVGILLYNIFCDILIKCRTD